MRINNPKLNNSIRSGDCTNHVMNIFGTFFNMVKKDLKKKLFIVFMFKVFLVQNMHLQQSNPLNTEHSSTWTATTWTEIRHVQTSPEDIVIQWPQRIVHTVYFIRMHYTNQLYLSV